MSQSNFALHYDALTKGLTWISLGHAFHIVDHDHNKPVIIFSSQSLVTYVKQS